ncbi:hypothetical protein [Humibacter sp.]|uniref:hypothetical protein n=1 Tax=Humibacter sp. TaxID=1940291 RepID=UPI003F7D3F2E
MTAPVSPDDAKEGAEQSPSTEPVANQSEPASWPAPTEPPQYGPPPEGPQYESGQQYEAGPQPTEQYPTQQLPSEQYEQTADKPKRSRMLTWLIAGGAAIVVLIIAGVVWASIETASHTPQAAVKPYLDALVKGDVKAAVKAGNIDTRSPLVTQKVYSKTSQHVTGYSIEPAHTVGSEATVTVKYRQGSSRYSEVLRLKNTGRDMLFFTRWRLEPITLPTVKIAVGAPAADGITVNGATVGAESEMALDALPGRYNVSLPSTANYTVADKSTTISDLKDTGDTSGKDVVALEATFTNAGQHAANDAVNGWVAACIAQPTLTPTGCSFYLNNTYPELHLSNLKWTLASAPVFDIGPWDGHGWPVTTTTDGSATFLADYTADDGSSGIVFSEAPVPVQVDGEITGFDKDGKAIFTSIDWSGKASQGSA